MSAPYKGNVVLNACPAQFGLDLSRGDVGVSKTERPHHASASCCILYQLALTCISSSHAKQVFGNLRYPSSLYS